MRALGFGQIGGDAMEGDKRSELIGITSPDKGLILSKLQACHHLEFYNKGRHKNSKRAQAGKGKGEEKGPLGQRRADAEAELRTGSSLVYRPTQPGAGRPAGCVVSTLHCWEAGERSNLAGRSSFLETNLLNSTEEGRRQQGALMSREFGN